MSYPVTLSSLPLLGPAPRRSALSDLQLLPWLRLAARQLLVPELQERLEPYRPCPHCVTRAAWCGDGGGDGKRWDADALQAVGPLTPSLVIGAKADPYPPAEAAQGRTRQLLDSLRTSWTSWTRRPRQASRPRRTTRPPHAPGRLDAADVLLPAPGMEVTIFTRSPLILRDLDLLVELDQRHVVTVGVLIPAARAALATRLERSESPRHRAPSSPSLPSPDTRFELVLTLAAHGLAAEVLCTPIVPGLNNGTAELGRLFAKAWEAGARDVRPAPRHPALPPTTAECRHLLPLFHRLRLEQGFPRTLPGRG
jgi:hypothetical protein